MASYVLTFSESYFPFLVDFIQTPQFVGIPYSKTLNDSITISETLFTNLITNLTVVNSQYNNRIQLLLGKLSYQGPLVSPTFGTFNPSRDLEIYADGQPLPASYGAFDPTNNRYLIYTSENFDPNAQLIQVIHHMPELPFLDVNNKIFTGFATIAASIPTGDPITYSMGLVLQSSAQSSTPLKFLWTSNTPQIEITLTNSSSFVVYSSGIFSAAAAAGILFIPGQIAGSYIASVTGYDAQGSTIIIGGNPFTYSTSVTLV